MTGTTKAIVFDDGLGEIAPLADLRPAFDIRTGPMTNLERLTRALGLEVLAMVVPEGKAELTRAAHPGISVNPATVPAADDAVMLLNGRCPLPVDAIKSIKPGQIITEASSGDLVAAHVPQARAIELLNNPASISDPVTIEEDLLLDRPWTFRAVRDACIEHDLGVLGDAAIHITPAGVHLIGSGSLTVAESATLCPGVTIDVTGGPVVIADRATVRPGAVVIGPVYVGPGSTILEQAVVRGPTSIGPVCKVAGEITGCVFQGYANKGHDGFLGDSWVGEWVNLGAGTTNSNLLNTYADVIAKAMPDGPNERTGEQFLGCVLGDHVKTAICTRIMTGAVVHTGTMWAATEPIAGCIGRYTWSTDAGRRDYRIDKFLDVARSAMGRRKIEMNAGYEARLRALVESLHSKGARL